MNIKRNDLRSQCVRSAAIRDFYHNTAATMLDLRLAPRPKRADEWATQEPGRAATYIRAYIAEVRAAVAADAEGDWQAASAHDALSRSVLGAM